MPHARSILFPALAAFVASAALAQPVVRTADPIKRGLKESDFPRTIKVTDNVYTYEDFHAGDEKFTTTNMFVVTDAGVLVADGQGNRAATKGLVGKGAMGANAPADAELVSDKKSINISSWTLARSQGPIAIRKVYEDLDGKLK
jgi:hypothetical protein